MLFIVVIQRDPFTKDLNKLVVVVDFHVVEPLRIPSGVKVCHRKTLFKANIVKGSDKRVAPRTVAEACKYNKACLLAHQSLYVLNRDINKGGVFVISGKPAVTRKV